MPRAHPRLARALCTPAFVVGRILRLTVSPAGFPAEGRLSSADVWFANYIVAGDSMHPTLNSRDVVLALRVPAWLLRSGQIVVAQPQHAPVIIKRVAAVHPDRRLSLVSDNADTTSAYTQQPLPAACVLGLVVWVYGRGRVEKPTGTTAR